MARKRSKASNGEGSVFLHPRKGVWVAQVQAGTTPSGRPRYITRMRKTREEAVQARRELLNAKDSGKLVGGSTVTLASFLSEWLEKNVRPHREPKTYQQYEYLVRVHIAPALGRKPVSKITRKDVQGLLAIKATQLSAIQPSSGEQKFLSPNTLRLVHAVIRSAYKEAILDGKASHNPAELVQIPRTRKGQGSEKWLEAVQARALLDALPQANFGEVLLFMLYTGSRVGEATGVRWCDLEFSGNFPSVTIRGQLQRIPGEGLKWKAGTKTNQVRAIPLTPHTVAVLNNIKAQRLVDGFSDPDGLVFLSPEGTRIDPKRLGVCLKEVCRKAGVPEISPHKLRHTAASLMLAGGANIAEVQKFLGHSQIALTADLYTHASAQTLSSAAVKLASLLDAD